MQDSDQILMVSLSFSSLVYFLFSILAFQDEEILPEAAVLRGADGDVLMSICEPTTPLEALTTGGLSREGRGRGGEGDAR